MEFSITFDYLCPFARNVCEALLTGSEQGRDWQVNYQPFSLAQAHVEPGQKDVWDRLEPASGVLALQWGLAVRDELPELFPAVHRALFAARHDRGRDINDAEVLATIVAETGADPQQIAAVVESGRPLQTLAAEHTELVDRWAVFGASTFVWGEEAVFVRLMKRNHVEDVSRIVELLSWTNLNEFKRTKVPA